MVTHRVRWRSRLGVLILLGFVGGLMYVTTATGGERTLKKATLRLDWTYLIYHSPFLYALQKGYYKQEGIDLKIEEGQGSQTTATLVGRGKDTFGFADTSTAVRLRSQGFKIKTALVIQRKSGFATACWKDVGFQEPKDLEGHSVLLIPQESTATVWPAYLAINGVDASKVKVVNADFSNKIQLFAAHKADCMAGVLGEDTLISQLNDPTHGIANAIPWANSGIKLFGHGIVVADSTITKDPALVRGFIAATIRGWREVCSKPSLGVGLFLKKFPNLSPSDRLYNSEALPSECSKLQGVATDLGRPLGTTTAAQWSANIAFLKKWAGLKTSEPAADFFTNAFIPKG